MNAESRGQCGHPLPATRLHALMREDADAAVVSAVMDGSVNRIDCLRCGYRGWVSIPLLWVDRVQKRAAQRLRGSQAHRLIGS